MNPPLMKGTGVRAKERRTIGKEIMLIALLTGVLLMTAAPEIPADRWKSDAKSQVIEWNVAKDAKRTHEAHIEMSGQKVSLIARYGVDADGNL